MLQLQYGNTLDLGQSGGWSYITIRLVNGVSWHRNSSMSSAQCVGALSYWKTNRTVTKRHSYRSMAAETEPLM